jgi:uncharacterized protein (DUF58 family)
MMGGVLARLRARVEASRAGWVQVRVTRQGLWVLLALAAVSVAALNTGNNLLYLVIAALLATLVASNVLAEWNLRGLDARFALPREIFAEEPAVGRVWLANRRRWGAAWLVAVELRGAAGERLAGAAFAPVAPGGEAELPVEWVFSRRGEHVVHALHIRSAYPFGWFERRWERAVGGTVLVYPAPVGGAVVGGRPVAVGEGAEADRGGGDGDLRSIRPFREGDPVRAVHWPTSARARIPMVVDRAARHSDDAIVELGAGEGPAFEVSVGVATGAVLAHLRAGRRPTLRVAGREVEVPRGADRRAALLGALARAGQAGP